MTCRKMKSPPRHLRTIVLLQQLCLSLSLTLPCLHFSVLFKQEMELALVGLQNAGKTSLVNAIAVSKQEIFPYTMYLSFLSLWSFL